MLGIGIIAFALYFGRMATPNSGGRLLYIFEGCLNPAMGVGLGIVKAMEVGMNHLQNAWVFIFAPLLGA